MRKGIAVIITSALLTAQLLLPFSGTQYAQADPFAAALVAKEYGLDTVVRLIARHLFNTVVSKLIQKVQGAGRGGSAPFVQNWRNFQAEALFRGEDVTRAQLASGNLCPHVSGDIRNLFRANTKISLSGNYLRIGTFDPFRLRINCTLPDNFNFETYKREFSANGGWEAFLRMTEPQNNYYGLLLLTLDEANRQRLLELQGDLSEVVSGGGYTNVRDVCQDVRVASSGCADVCNNSPSCNEFPPGSNERGTCIAQCIERCEAPSNARCSFLGISFTPGQLLGQTAASTIDKDLGWLTSSDEIAEIIIAVASALINRIGNFQYTNPESDFAAAPQEDQGPQPVPAYSPPASGPAFCVGGSCTNDPSRSCVTSADCGSGTNPPPGNQPEGPDDGITTSCRPALQQVGINEDATITASGGDGSYDWDAPGATILSEDEDSITVKYAIAAQDLAPYFVTVTSNSQDATCRIRIITSGGGGGGGGNPKPDPDDF